jgi:hypothetical protein
MEVQAMIYDEMDDRPNPEDERAEAWEFWHERAHKLEEENLRLRERVASLQTDLAAKESIEMREIERLHAKLAEYESVPVRLRHIIKTGTLPPEDMK